MTCNETSERLAAAVLGDLGRDERRAVHAHLANCDRCLEEERELLASLHLLRAHADEQPDADLHGAVMARAARSAAATVSPFRSPERRMGRVSRTLLTAAATALIVLGLQTLFQPAGPGPAVSTGSGVAAPVASLTGQAERRSPSLLEGTLFDRRRNVPEALRRFQQGRRRGDTTHPLDL